MITTSGKAGHPRAKVPTWTREQADKLLKTIQPMFWLIHHHVALGGGVLNNGVSYKDLDLYVLPFGDEEAPTLEPEVDALLEDVFEYQSPIGNDEVYGPQPAFRSRDRYTFEGKRVDVFVVRGQR